MAAKKKLKRGEKEDKLGLSQETKDSIVAIVAFVISAVFVLAWLNKAGWIGGILYNVSVTLLGDGYFLLPFVSFLVGLALIFSIKQKVVGLPLIGAALFLVFSLGLVDTVFVKLGGGLIGRYISMPFIYLFDKLVSSIIFISAIIISLLVIFNASLRRREKPETEEEADLSKRSLFSLPGLRGENNKEPQKLAEEVPAQTNEVPEEAGIAEFEAAWMSRAFKKDAQHARTDELKTLRKQSKNFALPPLSLLENDKGKPSAGDIKANANIIQRTLQEFGIPVEMGEVSVGPSVTQYTLKPAQGVKLSRIIALHNDLALALAAHPLRIEAPIPGRSLVGIEIPNRSIALVGLRSLLSVDEFQKSGALVFTIGRDVTGRAVYADLAKMPHLLVAGSTGSGKSVTVHSILSSLFYKNTPLSLRLILIDPKRVELNVYRSVPHLLAPVITDAKQTISALRWAVHEMERRYEVLQSTNKRDITSYNKSAKEFMPYIVIVIDELADLMAAYGREIEASVVRIAQMARAVGIHLVVSTQRPSVEVITGLIKANITSRIALQVASQVDSRTILDSAGAEKLLGNGDMLFLSGEAAKPKRVQGAFISEKEILSIAEFIRSQEAGLSYADDVVDLKETAPQGSILEFSASADDEDVLYDDAYGLVVEAGKASASYLQRRLRVGYARAARLMDLLEKNGVVGPADGAKPREVFINHEGDERHVA